MSEIPDRLEDITSYELVKLIREIFLCVEDKSGKTPHIDVLSEEIILIDFEGKRFRITIDDTSRYN